MRLLAGRLLGCGKAGFEEPADRLRLGIDAILEAIIVEAPDQVLVSDEEDFRFFAWHGSSLADLGMEGN